MEARAWIGCLACYNEGRLIGEWFEADEAADVTPKTLHAAYVKDDDDLLELIVVAHEEMWVMDHEGFGGWIVGECSPWEVQQVVDTIDSIERAHCNPDAVLAWALHTGERDEVVRDGFDNVQRMAFEDAFAGEFDSDQDFAYEWADGTGDLDAVPEHLRSYIDMEAYARDLMWDMFKEDAPGSGYYYFRSN